MKHHAIQLCLVISFSATFLKAQTNITNDYVIISVADVSATTSYSDALDAANWESFRLQNQRYQLAFANGFTIELKSAVELLNTGYPINLNNYQTALPAGYIPPTLTLLAGNVIGMTVNSIPSKSH